MNPVSKIHAVVCAGTSADRPAVAALSLSILLSSLGTSSVNAALPSLALAFDASFRGAQWVVLAYLLAITAFVVSAGRVSDVIGRKKMLLAGLLLFMGASLLCALAPWLWLLVAARIAQGTGAAMMMAMGMALVAGAVPKERAGSAMGMLGTMSAVGTAVGPSLGGLLVASFGWPAIFLVNLPLGLVAVLLAARYLPHDAAPMTAERHRFDVPGTLLLVLTLSAYALAMTQGGKGFDMPQAALLLAALLGLGLFVRIETKAAYPLVPLAMFRGPILGAGFVTSALVATVVMATLVAGPFYLAGALGLDAARVGFVMSCGPLAAALAGVPSGRLVDRFGPRPTMLASLSAMAFGCVALALATRFGVIGYILPLVVITSGYALFQSANNTAVMAGARTDQRGLVSGLMNLSRNLGLVTGASLMGTVFALGAGSPDIAAAAPQALADGVRATFAVSALLVVIALAISLRVQASSEDGEMRLSR